MVHMLRPGGTLAVFTGDADATVSFWPVPCGIICTASAM